MRPEDFTEFFREVTGFDPFPWQERLATSLCHDGWDNRRAWSEIYGLPTSAGKTSIQVAWVFALAFQLSRRDGKRTLPLRLFWVVDRRPVVDDSHDLGKRIEATLHSAPKGSVARAVRDALHGVAPNPEYPLEFDTPFRAVRMRGGLYRDPGWMSDPRVPTVVSTTVDQIGSALLFRKYGVRSTNYPMYAGLAANDSAIFVDEAQLSDPFMKVLDRIKEEHDGRLSLLQVTATSRDKATFLLNEEDLKHPILHRRLSCSKSARLVSCPSASKLPDVMCREAKALASGTNVVAIVCNTVATARAVFKRLRKTKKTDAILLTGRSRPWERDRLVEKWSRFFRHGDRETPERTLYVVSTQCIEAGADFDFDEMVTEMAPLDCLIQRAGRLCRAGRDGNFVIVGCAAKDEKAVKALDPVYGGRSVATWAWLLVQGPLDFSFVGQQKMMKGQELDGIVSPRDEAPYLTHDLFTSWAQTHPRPANSSSLDVFLHGYQRNSDVTVIWRNDLPETSTNDWSTIFAAHPAVNGEAMEVPIWEFKRMVAAEEPGNLSASVADVTGTPEGSKRVKELRPVLRWEGTEEDSRVITDAAEVRPGDVLVLPCLYGGADEFGLTGDRQDVPEDLADHILRDANSGRKAVRLYPGLVERDVADAVQALVKDARQDETPVDIGPVRELLREHVNELGLHDVQFKLFVYPDDKGVIVFDTPPRLPRDAGNWSSLSGKEVLLKDHCAHVGRWARSYAHDLLDDADLVDVLERSGAYHDVGKRDPGWQDFISAGQGVEGRWLAKAPRLPDLSLLPRGLRHEFISLIMLELSGALQDCSDPELVRYLVAVHHGRGRCFAPPYDDSTPEVTYSYELPNGEAVTLTTGCPYAKVDSGWSDRFFTAGQRYGWWKLAYLETVLRLADWRASAEEAK